MPLLLRVSLFSQTLLGEHKKGLWSEDQINPHACVGKGSPTGNGHTEATRGHAALEPRKSKKSRYRHASAMSHFIAKPDTQKPLLKVQTRVSVPTSVLPPGGGWQNKSRPSVKSFKICRAARGMSDSPRARARNRPLAWQYDSSSCCGESTGFPAASFASPGRIGSLMVYVSSRMCRGIRRAMRVMGGITFRICMMGSTPAQIISAVLWKSAPTKTTRGPGITQEERG